MSLCKCFIFGYLIFIILVVRVHNMKKPKHYNKKSNVDLKLYKNRTEANDKVQKLIKNYKQLERIYKSDRTEESDSGEPEIDEVFWQISSDNKNKEKQFREQIITTNIPSTYYRGTAYIYEYQENSELGGKDLKVKKEALKVEKETVNSQEETSEEDLLENNEKTKNAEKISGSDEIEAKVESDGIMKIKIKSPKKNQYIAPKQSRIENKEKRYPKNNIYKTRFSVLQSGNDNVNVKNEKSKIPLKIGNKRIVYSEQFSPDTIWDEIINRPIKLNRVISSKEISKLRSKENDKDTAIDLSDNTKKEDSMKRLDDFEIQEELSKNLTGGVSIFRNGYGCIQAPIKKCNKVLKTVYKNICKARFKCESDFKSDFDENSKKECVKKFYYTYSLSTKKSTTNINRDKKDDNYNHFQDATRQKHQNRSILTKKSFLSLRDKYEKRCQKELRNKCIAACNDVIKNTCLKHTCEKKKKKALEKACKEECKKIFIVDNKFNESSEDESSDSASASDSN